MVKTFFINSFLKKFTGVPIVALCFPVLWTTNPFLKVIKVDKDCHFVLGATQEIEWESTPWFNSSTR